MSDIIRYCRKKKHAGRRCDVCKEKATHKMEIATSFMRGDDELMILCDLHTKSAKEDPIGTWKLTQKLESEGT